VPRRSWRNDDVIELLSELILTRGVPEYMRSGNGSEFTAKQIRKWLRDAGFITAYIEPDNPFENGYIESFNARLRAEFLNGEFFETMYQTQVLTQRWVRYYNQGMPHLSLGRRSPAFKLLSQLLSYIYSTKNRKYYL
jgi:transposase InsO family protein